MSHPTPRSRPLQPISEATKSKLNAFQYHPQDEPDDALTEDEKTAKGESERRTKSHTADNVSHTPTAKLSWQELLEPGLSTDDDTNTSPNERLLWDNRQDPHYLAALSPMLSRRGKKRARSSSPASSPAAEHPQTPSVNVQKLAQALKTPHADPTLELWDRYSFTETESTSASKGIANPALAQLMVSSSPRPAKDVTPTPQNGDLRRAVSAGLNWPKRRKIEKSRSAGQVTDSQRELEAASKSSMVTALLNTVSSSIHDPSPCRTNKYHAESPLQRTKPVETPAPPLTKQPISPRVDKASSDYGDDEFDDDAFMELETSLSMPVQTSRTDSSNHKSVAPGDKRPSPSYGNELDDLDDELFDEADANAIVAAASQAPQQGSKATAPINISPDDEFEDDFDADIDFDAVELAATQSFKKAPVSIPAVR